MSKEQLQAFLRHAKSDADLCNRLLQVKGAEAFQNLANEAGFSISNEALANAEDISLDQLAEIQGGGLYIKCDGIEGEATDSNHSRWIIADSGDLPVF